MKLSTLLLLPVAAALAACGDVSGEFSIKGRFLNFNQGQLFVYRLDTPEPDIDTVKVRDGRFEYHTPLEGDAVYMLLFPNFSEVAVFGTGGKTAKVKADASHLKEVEVSGTDLNKEMTDFRHSTAAMERPQLLNAAEKHIKANPASPVSLLLAEQLFLRCPQPDYKRGIKLLQLIAKASGEANPRAEILLRRLQSVPHLKVGDLMPSFSATDINGRTCGTLNLRSEINIVYVWSTWAYSSMDVQQRVKMLRDRYPGRLSALGVCIDASVDECRKAISRDSLPWPTICDGRMWQTPVMKTLGAESLPANFIADKSGRILARDLSAHALEKKVDNTLAPINKEEHPF